MILHDEILEQPQRLRHLLESQRETAQRIAQAIRSHDVQYVVIAARGTSDNAARYATYLWGALNGLPVALATPSLFTYYQTPPRMRGALVVGISQSGQSPDIVQVIEEGKRQGCLTLAITNTPDSPLAQIAEYHFDIQAGAEKAVAATKTYTAQLTAIAMIAAAFNESSKLWAELWQLPAWAEEVLKDEARIEQAVQRYRYMERCAVLGRGFNYATAFEWALKLKELTYVAAEPYSSADFLHGPIAMVQEGFPVMVVAPQGKIFASVHQTLEQLRKLRAETVVISNGYEALNQATTALPIPEGVPEWLSPLVSILPAQLFTYYLTLARGYDPDHPRTIFKVTRTE